MKVNVRHLKEGENLLSYDSRKDPALREVADHLGTQGYRLEKGLAASLKLTKIDPDLYLEGTIGFSVERDCSRCAESFWLPISHSFSMTFSKSEADQSPKEETEALDVTLFSDDELQLGPPIEEQFVLSLPYQSLCRPDCKGICQDCGKNKNAGDCRCVRKDSDSPFAILEKVRGTFSKKGG